MKTATLSLTEWAVLGLLAEGPGHGFAISQELAPSGDIGRIFTVRRPLVYRALDRLIEAGLVEPKHTEPGNLGPPRLMHRITPKGRRALRLWLNQPVAHVRDIRIGFQLKLAFLERSDASPLPLITAQQVALERPLDALERSGEDRPDHLELWRQYNAKAAAAYLEELSRVYGS
ncbi:MAG: PadR family transcriptional regulator [Acidimicrobiia bacterium]